MHSLHEKFMKRCLKLAVRGMGRTSPNPLVGCVIVKNFEIISEGWHHACGKPHAEADAISKLTAEQLKNTSLYVNLEPCSHQGRTPPCSDLIVRSGISHVIYAVSDQNPLTKGKSTEIFRKAHITVAKNILREKAVMLNLPFFRSITEKRSFVTLKIAQTLDGRIADFTGKSQFITCAESRKKVHQLRFESDAILVGVNTVISDDPLLTVRDYGKTKKLQRIVLDPSGRIPLHSRLVKSASEIPLLIVGHRIPPEIEKSLESADVQILRHDPSDLKTLLEILYQKFSIGKLLVEGGGVTHGHFLRCRLADELRIFISPRILGSQAVPSFSSADILLENAVRFFVRSRNKYGEDTEIHLLSEENACLPDLLKQLGQ